MNLTRTNAPNGLSNPKRPNVPKKNLSVSSGSEGNSKKVVAYVAVGIVGLLLIVGLIALIVFFAGSNGSEVESSVTVVTDEETGQVAGSVSCTSNQHCVNNYGAGYYCGMGDGKCYTYIGSGGSGSGSGNGSGSGSGSDGSGPTELVRMGFFADFFPKPALSPVGDIYYNDGNVGIGTDTPEALLHIEGSGNTGIVIRSSDDNAGLKLSADSMDVVPPGENQGNNNIGIRFFTSGVERTSLRYNEWEDTLKLLKQTGNSNLVIESPDDNAGLFISADENDEVNEGPYQGNNVPHITMASSGIPRTRISFYEYTNQLQFRVENLDAPTPTDPDGDLPILALNSTGIIMPVLLTTGTGDASYLCIDDSDNVFKSATPCDSHLNQ
jgi:hypothetical protein